MEKKIKNIVDEIKLLSVTEFLALNEALKEEFKITPEMLTVNTGGSREDKEETPVEDVNKKVALILKDLGGATTISYIKAVKDALGLTIDAAKGHITKIASGESIILKDGLTKKEAEELKTKLTSITPGLGLDIK